MFREMLLDIFGFGLKFPRVKGFLHIRSQSVFLPLVPNGSCGQEHLAAMLVLRKRAEERMIGCMHACLGVCISVHIYIYLSLSLSLAVSYSLCVCVCGFWLC